MKHNPLSLKKREVWQMKMLLIVYSEVADDEMLMSLKKAGIKAYTKMQEACGEGSETEPKLGTHYWPGKNNILFVAVKDEEVSIINDALSAMKKDHPKAGIRSYILPVEEQVL
jgi:nitrogen regulatory protein PII